MTLDSSLEIWHKADPCSRITVYVQQTFAVESFLRLNPPDSPFFISMQSSFKRDRSPNFHHQTLRYTVRYSWKILVQLKLAHLTSQIREIDPRI